MQTVGCHEFRNHLGYYLEHAASGEAVSITRRGKPFARLLPASDGSSQMGPRNE
jgi:prevent-host-death family protein